MRGCEGVSREGMSMLDGWMTGERLRGRRMRGKQGLGHGRSRPVLRCRLSVIVLSGVRQPVGVPTGEQKAERLCLPERVEDQGLDRAGQLTGETLGEGRRNVSLGGGWSEDSRK